MSAAQHCCRVVSFVFVFSFSLFSQINITGTVRDAGGNGIAGAMVSVIGAGKSAVTDANGAYSIVSGTTGAHPRAMASVAAQPFLRGNTLHFEVVNHPERVKIELYDLSGRRIKSLLDRNLPRGDYQINLKAFAISSRLYFLKAQIGANAAVIKMPVINGAGAGTGNFIKQQRGIAENGFSKFSATVDSMLAGSVGYNTAARTIDNYTGVYDFVLDKTVAPGNVMVIQTSQAGDRLASKPVLTFAADDGSTLPTISVDTAQKFQTIFGFGAAFTETAVYCMSNIGPGPRKEIMDLFFNPFTGAGFTLGRTQIGACDFSVGAYFYDETAGDFNLNNFSISHEQQWMIPMIKQAKAVPGADVKIFAAPWSPPPWMKTTSNWLHGSLKTDSYAAFALYLSMYVQEMKSNGIDIWGITMQNEPEFDSPWYPSCSYTPQQERDFLKNYFGPQLALDKLFPGIKVMIWDHNKDNLNTWGDVIIGDTAAAKYVWGAAYHWYSGDMFDRLVTFHGKYPNRFLIETEVAEPFKGLNADSTFKTDWGQAERECHDLVGDMNNWSNGWNEWNLCADEKGGPGYTGSVGSAPIMTNLSRKTYFVQPHYYMIAHFSKYVRPGAMRIGYAATGIPANVEFTAFRNANGTVVVVIMNRTAAAVSIKLRQGTQIVKPSVPAHGFMTLVF
jgi:glucosylceramidase